jgi:hypothetical protein
VKSWTTRAPGEHYSKRRYTPGFKANSEALNLIGDFSVRFFVTQTGVDAARFFEQFMRHPVAWAMVKFRSEDGSLLLAGGVVPPFGPIIDRQPRVPEPSAEPFEGICAPLRIMIGHQETGRSDKARSLLEHMVLRSQWWILALRTTMSATPEESGRSCASAKSGS